MAGQPLIKRIRVVLDEASRRELTNAFRTAGKDSFEALQAAFKLHMADLKNDLARNLIDKEQFKKQSEEAARAFNEGILARIKELGTQGKLTSEEYVKLTSHLKAVGSEGGKSVGLLEQGWARLKTLAAGLGATIAVAFGVRQIIAFGKESVQAAMESESAWSRLSVAVQNAGVDFESVRHEIDLATAAIQNSTRFSDEAALEALTRLTTMTGDYATALKLLPVVADLASFAQIGLSDAAKLLGKAIGRDSNEGTVRALEQQIGKLDKTKDLLPQVAERVRGFAEKDLTTMSGALAHVGNLWDEFKEAIGRAMIAGADGAGVMEKLSLAIKAGTAWVVEHKDQIAKFAEIILKVGVFAVQELGRFITDTAWIVEKSSSTFSNFGHAVLEAWNQMLSGIAGLLAQAMVKIQDFIRAAAGVADAIGLDEAARKMRVAADSMQGTINSVEEFARQKRVAADQHTMAIQSNLRESATQTSKTVSETSAQAGKDLGDNLSIGADRAKAKVAELSSATMKHMGAMAQAYALSGDQILAGKDKVVAAFKQLTETMIGTTEELQATNAIVMSQYVNQIVPAMLQGRGKEIDAIHEQKAAVEDLKDRVRAGTDYYTDEHVPEILKGTRDIDDGLHQLAASQDGVTDTFRGGEQYYTKQYTPAILQGHGKQQAAAKETEKVHSESYEAIRRKIDDVTAGVGGIISVLGLADTAVGRLVNGFAQAAGKAAGFVASIASGNWLGALAQGLGLVGDIIDALGGVFSGGKDDDRHAANSKAYDQATSSNPSEQLKGLEFLLRKSPKERGGAGGWATRAAQEDAWNFYTGAMQYLREHGGVPEGWNGPGSEIRTAAPGSGGGRSSPPPRPPSGGGGPITQTPGGGSGGGITTTRRHQGGIVGDDWDTWAPASLFDRAPRYHAGGRLGWNERAIIAEVGEFVLTPAQMAALSARGSSVHIERIVVNAGAGANGVQIARDLARELNVQFGGELTMAQAKRGNTTR